MPDKTLKIKICGMKDPGNIAGAGSLLPDYMGFIYYPGSPRFVGGLSPEDIGKLPDSIRKTGVFVNSELEDVLYFSGKMGFRALQLHGDESPEYCRKLKEEGFEIIKVFSIGNGRGFDGIEQYMDHCELFLFDTAGKAYGGTGKKFGWDRLEEYKLEKGFFLSGGLAPGDLEAVLEIRHPQLYGLDLNSGFETEPALKNLDQLASFMDGIRKPRKSDQD